MTAVYPALVEFALKSALFGGCLLTDPPHLRPAVFLIVMAPSPRKSADLGIISTVVVCFRLSTRPSPALASGGCTRWSSSPINPAWNAGDFRNRAVACPRTDEQGNWPQAGAHPRCGLLCPHILGHCDCPQAESRHVASRGAGDLARPESGFRSRRSLTGDRTCLQRWAQRQIFVKTGYGSAILPGTRNPAQAAGHGCRKSETEVDWDSRDK